MKHKPDQGLGAQAWGPALSVCRTWNRPLSPRNEEAGGDVSVALPALPFFILRGRGEDRSTHIALEEVQPEGPWDPPRTLKDNSSRFH